MYTIDRIEENTAVITDENENRTYVSTDMIDGDVRESAVITKEGGRWRIDEKSTKERKAEMKNRLERLFKRE